MALPKFKEVAEAASSASEDVQPDIEIEDNLNIHEDDGVDESDLEEQTSGDDESSDSDAGVDEGEMPVAEAHSDLNSSADSEDNYKVLYQRFRPRKFSEIVGQDSIVRALKSAAINGTIANTYLFTGSRGCGKTTTARVFATALNCPNAKNGEPCGTCSLCISVRNGHGAIGVTEYDAANNSGVEDIRRISAEVQFSQSSRRNIVIIDEVHLVSKQGNGALLKTLEEPPPGVVFILCTTNPERLEPAVRSRAVPFKFNEFTDDLMLEYIRGIAKSAGLEPSESQLVSAVRKGAGSPRDALSALERSVADPEGYVSTYVNYAEKITEAVSDKDISKIIVAVAEAIDSGESPSEVTSTLLSYWRNVLLSMHAPELVKVTSSEVEIMTELGRELGSRKIIRMMTELGQNYARITHGDPRVFLESGLIQLVIPVSNAESIREVSEKVDDLLDVVISSESSPRDKAKSEVAEEAPLRDEIAERVVRDNPVESKPEVKKEEKRIPKIISDNDDLIDAIFDKASPKLGIALPSLEVHKSTTTEKLVLDSHKKVTDAQWDELLAAVSAVDPREIELIED